jgi:starch-binding outer membrane protein, SusD/RagB family
MISYARTRSILTRLRRSAAVLSISVAAAGALPLTSCSPDDFLTITDPDIINPDDVQSAAGANAVRLGAISRFKMATSGAPPTGADTSGLFLLGGLFADEWINGDSFIARQEIDQRVITPENTFLTATNRMLHRARFNAELAVELLAEWVPNAPAWQVGEMHFIQAYVANISAEHYCDGLVFSDVVDGREVYGTPITVIQTFERALEHANDGLALTFGTDTASLRVQRSLQAIKGRILLNLNRPAEAATAVTGVPANFAFNHAHSTTTSINGVWQYNNTARRYSVGNAEGGNGINFATAADPRLPVCVGGTSGCISQSTRDDQSQPIHVQRKWPNADSPVAIITGVEARMIRAEALLRAGNFAAALDTINAARTAVTGLAPLTDPGTDSARVSLLFRERAFWMFGTGTRVGDLRRLIRQYGRPQNTVFPTGVWHKGGNYGTDVNMPVPQAELNNPNVEQACLNRNA